MKTLARPSLCILDASKGKISLSFCSLGLRGLDTFKWLSDVTGR